MGEPDDFLAASPSDIVLGGVSNGSPVGLWHRLLRDRAALAGLLIVAVLLALAVAGPTLTPKNPLKISRVHALGGPSGTAPFGTDNLGRDTLSRVIAGARVSVSLALITGLAIMAIGVVIGAVAGYRGGWIDTVAMRVVDVLLAFPTLILALAIAGVLGGGYRSLLVAMVSTWWPTYARLTRGGILAEREREYIDAVRGLGARPRRIVLRHLLPNVVPPVLVLMSFDLGMIILAVAALGYLGVGISPPTPEWGTMVAAGRDFVFINPWMIVFPGLAIAVAVIGFNLLGEGLRDALDPQNVTQRGRRDRRRDPARITTTARSQTPPLARDAGVPPDLLTVSDLRVSVRQRGSEVVVVDGISLSVHGGETVGLVGESGSGKTMTGLSIMGLLPPGGRVLGGRVHLAGRDLTAMSDTEMDAVRGREIAMVFQDPMSALNPTMTIGDQIADPVRLHLGMSKKQALSRATEVLALAGLARPLERLSDYPHQLSGGQRQRVVIAMAISCSPKVLIADEPTTALDVTIQAQILDLLKDLQGHLGMGMILITHDMGVIARMADRVMVIYAGRTAETSTTATLFECPRHPYTSALLQSIPQPNQDRRRELYSIPGKPPSLAAALPWCRFEPRCPYATEQCRGVAPTLDETEPNHAYACFHPLAPLRVPPDAPVLIPATASPPERAAKDAPSQLLVVDHLVKEFPGTGAGLRRNRSTVKAVSDVSFTVAQGETFGLVGESGCGKTTIGRMIVALEQPGHGSVRLDGLNVNTLSGQALRRRRRDLQLVFQNPYASLDPRMPIGLALREPMDVQEIGSRAERDARVHELLQEVGLDTGSADLYPHEFSGGQRQRIGLARALALRPRLIVADEPVSALDMSIRSQILNLMKQLQAAHGLTYIVISHDLSVIRYMADRVGVMYLGKLVEVGPQSEIFDRPAHPYTAALLQAIPLADPALERAKPRAAVQGEPPSAADPPSGCCFRTRCPLAQQRCATEAPPMRPFSENGHSAACHFPLQPAMPSPAAVPVTSGATND